MFLLLLGWLMATNAVTVERRGDSVLLTVLGESFLLDPVRYPWFVGLDEATLQDVDFWFEHHVHWEGPDIDLDLDALRHPEKYPLIFFRRP